MGLPFSRRKAPPMLGAVSAQHCRIQGQALEWKFKLCSSGELCAVPDPLPALPPIPVPRETAL